jgi:multidrug resistance efflux pump
MPAHTGWRTTIRPAPRPEQPDPDPAKLQLLQAEEALDAARRTLARARNAAPHHRRAILDVEARLSRLGRKLIEESRR